MQVGEETLTQDVREATVEIKNAAGLHMRPAMLFVGVADQFDCEIAVSSERAEVDAKSIMQISLLMATCGTRLKIRAQGPEADEAIDALKELVEVRMFDEPPPSSKKQD